PLDVGGDPSSLAVDSSGRFLLVSTFPLGATGANCLLLFSIDADSGALTPVPGSPFALPQACGPVAADPAGPYFYAGSALQSVNPPATVFVFSIDESTVIGGTSIPDQKLGVASIALTH